MSASPPQGERDLWRRTQGRIRAAQPELEPDLTTTTDAVVVVVVVGVVRRRSDTRTCVRSPGTDVPRAADELVGACTS